jgi:hypothetical protein
VIVTSTGHLDGLLYDLTIPSTGLLGAPGWPLDDAAVPAHLEVLDDHLCWKMVVSRDRFYQRKNPDGMLDRFIRLRTAGGVLRFARSYGVLMLCQHNLPATHNPACGRVVSGREPIATWLHFARQAAAILTIAARLHDGKLGERREWATIYEWVPADDRDRQLKSLGLSLVLDRWALATLIDEWLDLGAVRPHFHWYEGQEPGFEFGPLTFTLLAMQLMVAVCRASAWAKCDGCQNLYLRMQRRPAHNRRNYCPDCSERGIPERDRKRRQRAREQ